MNIMSDRKLIACIAQIPLVRFGFPHRENQELLLPELQAKELEEMGAVKFKVEQTPEPAKPKRSARNTQK
jgi:hypothetical protein